MLVDKRISPNGSVDAKYALKMLKYLCKNSEFLAKTSENHSYLHQILICE
ncbi:hypothetical protein [Aeromonas phage Akh-2]|nr:hypothetical protein [Aeromonas phage Akh-2]